MGQSQQGLISLSDTAVAAVTPGPRPLSLVHKSRGRLHSLHVAYTLQGVGTAVELGRSAKPRGTFHYPCNVRVQHSHSLESDRVVLFNTPCCGDQVLMQGCSLTGVRSDRYEQPFMKRVGNMQKRTK